MKIYRDINGKEDKLIRKVLNNYDFNNGKISIRRNLVANVNAVYLILVGNKKYILRHSETSKTLAHLRSELDILKSFHRQGFPLTPYPIPNKNGKDITIVGGSYFTLLNFMPGENKASWNNVKNFNGQTVINFFEAFGKFSLAASKIKQTINSKENRPLYYYVKNGRKLFNNFLKEIPSSKVKKLLQENENEIISFVQETSRELEELKYDKLSKQIVHFDFHPGNVNFIGNKVSGIFDFDWVRVDCRFSDLAGAIAQSCYWYGGPKGGLYDKQKMVSGLNSYRKAYGKSEFNLQQENLIIRTALKGYVFFQLLWCMNWYKNNLKDPRAFEYFDHFLKVLKLNDYDWLFEVKSNKGIVRKIK